MIGVAGASGGLGGRIAARLAGRGIEQRLIVRDPARAPSHPGAEVVQATMATTTRCVARSTASRSCSYTAINAASISPGGLPLASLPSRL